MGKVEAICVSAEKGDRKKPVDSAIFRAALSCHSHMTSLSPRIRMLQNVWFVRISNVASIGKTNAKRNDQVQSLFVFEKLVLHIKR